MDQIDLFNMATPAPVKRTSVQRVAAVNAKRPGRAGRRVGSDP